MTRVPFSVSQADPWVPAQLKNGLNSSTPWGARLTNVWGLH